MLINYGDYVSHFIKSAHVRALAGVVDSSEFCKAPIVSLFDCARRRLSTETVTFPLAYLIQSDYLSILNFHLRNVHLLDMSGMKRQSKRLACYMVYGVVWCGVRCVLNIPCYIQKM